MTQWNYHDAYSRIQLPQFRWVFWNRSSWSPTARTPSTTHAHLIHRRHHHLWQKSVCFHIFNGQDAEELRTYGLTWVNRTTWSKKVGIVHSCRNQGPRGRRIHNSFRFDTRNKCSADLKKETSEHNVKLFTKKIEHNKPPFLINCTQVTTVDKITFLHWMYHYFGRARWRVKKTAWYGSTKESKSIILNVKGLKVIRSFHLLTGFKMYSVALKP